MVRTLAIVMWVAVLVPGCVDERACEACITDQVELRTELIAEGLAPEDSLESRAYYREACQQRVIAPSRPCAPKVPVVALLGLLGAVVCVGLWLRHRRARR